MSLQYDEHRQYLADTQRLDAFARALAETVRPGDVVVDIGSGTGILAALALRAGAARVYAIEGGGMIDVARQIAADNGVADRISFLSGLSTRLDLPEPVDVVVSDLIGRVGFEAGVMQYSADAVRRWLKPGGRVIPSLIQTWVAPVQAPALTAMVDFWSSRPAGVDVSAARAGAANTGYPAAIDESMWLSPPAPVLTLTPLTDHVPVATGTCRTTVAMAGMMGGLGGWFRAELAPGVVLTNAPDDPARIRRRQAFLPIETPIPVEIGDVIDVSLRARPEEVVLAWDVTVRRGGRLVARAAQSTLSGMLVPGELLRRTRQDHRPRLSPWAHARATVIALCDGVRTLREVEQETASRHGDLFVDADAAAVFVAEVVTRYGRPARD